jgi:Domain of unknown function (DUF4388)
MLADLPLEELLQYLAEKRASGTLAVVAAQATKRAFLLDGELAGVASNNPRELLGHFLVGWGLISEEQLREAMHIQESLGTPLGRIIERMGAVDPASLAEALQAQAEETLLDLFLAPVVEKRFLENVLPADRPLVLRLPVPPLVLEGLRRRRQMAELSAALGDLDVVLRRTDAAPPDGLSARDHHILAEIDGERDLEAVALICHLVPFHVAEFVARGVREGFVAVESARREDAAPASGTPLARAEAALERRELRECWDELQAARAAANDAGARAAAEALENRLGETLAARRIAGHLIPWLVGPAPDISRHALRPDEAFVLSRVNHRWNLREVQRVTPVPELLFGVIVDTLLNLKAIELRHPKGGPAVS